MAEQWRPNSILSFRVALKSLGFPILRRRRRPPYSECNAFLAVVAMHTCTLTFRRRCGLNLFDKSFHIPPHTYIHAYSIVLHNTQKMLIILPTSSLPSSVIVVAIILPRDSSCSGNFLKPHISLCRNLHKSRFVTNCAVDCLLLLLLAWIKYSA